MKLSGTEKDDLKIKNGVKVKGLKRGKFKAAGVEEGFIITDINNMGAAMAPAAAATLLRYLKDTGSAPADWAASMINGTRHFRHISASCSTGRI